MPTVPTKTSPIYYEIQIAGQLSPEQAEWFGLSLMVELTKEDMNMSTLSGLVIDQAALYGILNRIRDLGLKLISVHQVEADDQIDRSQELDLKNKRRIGP